MTRVLCLLLLGLALAAACGVRWNRSPSLPPGLYRLHAASRVERGNLVLVCPAADAAALARRRGYLGPGRCPGGVEPIGKPVAAVGGDRVRHTAAAVIVNHVPRAKSATLPRDARGRPVPHPPFGERRLRAGELWLLSTRHPRSFDSRYLGVVRSTQLRGVLTPLWVRGAAP